MKGKRGKSIAIASSNKNRILFSLSILTVLGLIYLIRDYHGPKTISLYNDNAFGFSCLRASDLLVQEYDQWGNLWATRGMKVYKLKRGDEKFQRVAHVPTGFSIFWIRNFSIIRKLTIRPECVELTASANGDLCALSAGKIWYKPANSGEFHETFRLSNYGFGDQGIRNDGIINIDDSTYYFGEYFRNPERDKVRLYRSSEDMSYWEVAYQFQPRQVRHIHSIQKDPYSNKIWVCTGDNDDESMIMWSDDNFNTINKIGYGNQIWRVCQLVFTEENIFWGTDTGSENISGIYSWNRQNAKLKKHLEIDGAVFFGTRLRNGTIVLSTNREGAKNEKDDKTRLYIFYEGNAIKVIECGTWDHKKPGFWYKYAMLRFQRDQGGPSLAITCLNQKEFPDSELIIISEKEIQANLNVDSFFPGN